MGKDLIGDIVLSQALEGESEQHGQLRVEGQVFGCSMLKLDGGPVVERKLTVGAIRQILYVHGYLRGKAQPVERIKASRHDTRLVTLGNAFGDGLQRGVQHAQAQFLVDFGIVVDATADAQDRSFFSHPLQDFVHRFLLSKTHKIRRENQFTPSAFFNTFKYLALNRLTYHFTYNFVAKIHNFYDKTLKPKLFLVARGLYILTLHLKVAFIYELFEVVANP